MELLIWPAVVIIVAIFFMIYFRKSISKKIDQVKKAGGGGVDFDTEQLKAKDVQPSPVKTADDLIKGIDGKLIREIEDESKKTIEGMPDPEKIKVLLRVLAATYWNYMAINIYRMIYGSQIAALEFLNTKNRIPRDSLLPFYAAGVSQYPEHYEGYSYDQWLGFLESQLLLTHEANLIVITVRGQEFLQFLVSERLTKVKAG